MDSFLSDCTKFREAIKKSPTVENLKKYEEYLESYRKRKKEKE